MNETSKGLALLALAFFLGSVPFGYIVGRMKGIDLREHGSRNIGATNTLRVLGKGPGIVVLLLDALKGMLPVLAAQGLSLPAAWIVGVGMAAMLGHIFSPFLHFKGGKGVATALGVVIALSPIASAISVGVFLATVLLTRFVSLGSILGAITIAALFFVFGEPVPYRIFSLLAAAFIIFRHKENIKRLMNGTESRFGANKTEEPGERP